ncbi:NAD(P)/FAD-dependent oxidoreductase [Micromonospora sp. CPCC 206061]|uniref:NAD(P)/FAD-dependent oxidoreductase n=1 Tax=Micromonospora sp. CPCC 206061 TaxID=3122410 RepID=UPI002FF26C9F
MSTVGSLQPRPPLPGPIVADVAIVGAGYTGLWTAYYLARAEPSLRIAVVEKEIAGFGASGRNGGWCSALFPTPAPLLARRHGKAGVVAIRRAMEATVDEVGRVAAAEGIDCDWAKGGTVTLARTPAQLRRAEAAVRETEDLVLLSADEARKRCGATRVLGGTYTPNCAAIHPARLVRGLARAVEARGVTIYEGTPALRLRKGAVDTPAGAVRAPVVIRATEAYTSGLPGLRRAIAPIYSLIVATPPLPDAFWVDAGLAERETFSDFRRLIIYGQRTADNRLVFGGRGAPYHFGSRTRPEYDSEPRVFEALRRTLADLFPALGSVPLTHSWGGAVGIPADWSASVGLDRSTGLGWAGGYVGDGVGTANLAGRTLADLVLGVESDLTALPWVGHRSPHWAPEPLRWVGVNAVRKLVTWADAARL